MVAAEPSRAAAVRRAGTVVRAERRQGSESMSHTIPNCHRINSFNIGNLHYILKITYGFSAKIAALGQKFHYAPGEKIFPDWPVLPV